MNYNDDQQINNNNTTDVRATLSAGNNLQEPGQQQNLPNQQYPQQHVNQPVTYSGAPSPWQHRAPDQSQHENINPYQKRDNVNSNRHQTVQQPQQQQHYQANSSDGHDRQNAIAQSIVVPSNNDSRTSGGSNEAMAISGLHEQITALKHELAAKSESNFELNATIATMQAEMDAEINTTKNQAKEETSRLQGELRLAQQQALRAQQQLVNFKQRQQQDQKQPPQQRLQSAPNQGYQESVVPPIFPSDRLLGVTTANTDSGGGGGTPCAYDPSIPKIITANSTTNNATNRRQLAPTDAIKRDIFRDGQSFHETIDEKQEGVTRTSVNVLDKENDGVLTGALNGTRDAPFLQTSQDAVPPIDATKSNISNLIGGPFPSGQVLARHLVDLYGSIASTTLGQPHASPLREILIGIATSTSSSTTMSPMGLNTTSEKLDGSTLGGHTEFISMKSGLGRSGWTEASVSWCVVQALVMKVEQAKSHRIHLQQQNKSVCRNDYHNNHSEETATYEQESQRDRSNCNGPETTPMEIDPVSPPSPNVVEGVRTMPTTATGDGRRKNINRDVRMSARNLIQYLFILKHTLTVSAEGRSELIKSFRTGEQQRKHENDRSLAWTNANKVSDPGFATNASPAKSGRFSSRLRIVSSTTKSAVDNDEMKDDDDEKIVSDIATAIPRDVVDKALLKLQNPFLTQYSERSFQQQQPRHPQANFGEHAFSSLQRCNWSRSLVGSLMDILSWEIHDECSEAQTSAPKLLDRCDSYSASTLSCQILALMISADSRPDNVWWEVCVEPITSAFYYYSSLLLGISSTEATMAKSDYSGANTNVRLRQQQPSPYLPYRHQYRRRRRRRQFRRVATPQNLIQSVMKNNKTSPTKLARDKRDEEMHGVSKLVTALLALLQRLLYVTSTSNIYSWWSASSHPVTTLSTIADDGRKTRSSSRMNVDNDKVSAPRTASDGTNGYYLVSVILDLMELEWNIAAESPSWYQEGINLLRYIASIPLDDGTHDLGKTDNHPWNMIVLRTRLYPTTAIFSGLTACQEEKELDDQGKVIPPPLLGNAIDVAIFSLHKLVLSEPPLSDEGASNSHRLFLTSCMEAWIRFLHLIFLFVQQQQEDEEEFQNSNDPEPPRTIEILRGKEADEEAQSSKMDNNATNNSQKAISFRSLVEDCQDFYTSSYAMILTTPADNDESKKRSMSSATWGVRDEIKAMMRLQLEELAMDEEEYEELHGVSL